VSNEFHALDAPRQSQVQHGSGIRAGTKRQASR